MAGYIARRVRDLQPRDLAAKSNFADPQPTWAELGNLQQLIAAAGDPNDFLTYQTLLARKQVELLTQAGQIQKR